MLELFLFFIFFCIVPRTTVLFPRRNNVILFLYSRVLAVIEVINLADLGVRYVTTTNANEIRRSVTD
ncbi:hypothetical protein PUN28_001948 [Cardiocondyla obscurior]|uniref:Secreted protein n=1 Tax=Cardiocondyla obscurior TaxID=286306 RepID=A0AAW2GRX5_9HYME